eukprot:CAMPEP_0183718348 /NCGR_PEP_ID=MMETSP0737-20130205/11631_1 /TAXON_ID=385413 /ORGANISM="Thalassiosira miniscula, Strain CCMP1093" /LENGTH=914 /DNA_ID=CAMNT_0025947893 /DNA_START=195 /DNA_END=2940 /DNA_ORIENTATION=+
MDPQTNSIMSDHAQTLATTEGATGSPPRHPSIGAGEVVANNERNIADIARGTPPPMILEPPRPETNMVLDAMNDPVNKDIEMREAVAIKIKNIGKPNEISPPKPSMHPAMYVDEDDVDATNKMERFALEPPTRAINPSASAEEAAEAASSESGNQRNDINDRIEENRTISDINVIRQGEGNSIHREESTRLEADDRPSRPSDTTIFYDGSDARVEFAPPPSLPSDPEDPTVCDSNHPLEVPDAYVVKSTKAKERPSLPSFMERSAILAEPLEPDAPWYQKRWGKVLIVVIVALVIALVLMILFTVVYLANGSGTNKAENIPSEMPSMSPSFSPSHDKQPTLEIVRERRVLRCGLRDEKNAPINETLALDGLTEVTPQEIVHAVESFNIYTREWCRAIASVVLGDPNAIEPVPVTYQDRFIILDNREIDVLMLGDYYELQREIREPTTQVGFAFSRPYFYAGIAYGGETHFVECAENRSRSGNPCRSLKICVVGSTSIAKFIQENFPPSFIVASNSSFQVLNGFIKGECNVIAEDLSFWVTNHGEILDLMGTADYALGETVMAQEFISIVMRNNDMQWVDIVTRTVDDQFVASSVGMAVQNKSTCPLNSTNDLGINFMSAPACIGNVFASITADESLLEVFSPIINGTTDNRKKSGLVWAPTFGDLTCSYCPDALKDATLARIKERGHLNCGVIVDDNLPGLTEMGKIYCRAIAVAIFWGGVEAVNIMAFTSFNSSLDFFYTDYVDVVAGGMKYSLVDDWSLTEWNSELSGDFAFSIPYYYQDVVYPNINNYTIFRPISLVTRAGDALWSSFVNSVVVCGINAVGLGINKESGSQMPLIGLFGPELRWIFRDVVLYSGHYDEIFAIAHNLTDDDTFDRGPNKASQAIFYWEYYICLRILSSNPSMEVTEGDEEEE